MHGVTVEADAGSITPNGAGPLPEEVYAVLEHLNNSLNRALLQTGGELVSDSGNIGKSKCFP
jgi:hypothetical protein